MLLSAVLYPSPGPEEINQLDSWEGALRKKATPEEAGIFASAL
jgi:hypothetical protein